MLHAPQAGHGDHSPRIFACRPQNGLRCPSCGRALVFMAKNHASQDTGRNQLAKQNADWRNEFCQIRSAPRIELPRDAPLARKAADVAGKSGYGILYLRTLHPANRIGLHLDTCLRPLGTVGASPPRQSPETVYFDAICWKVVPTALAIWRVGAFVVFPCRPLIIVHNPTAGKP